MADPRRPIHAIRKHRKHRKHRRVEIALVVTCALVCFILGFMVVSVAMRGLG